MSTFYMKHGETKVPVVADMTPALAASGFASTDDIADMVVMIKAAVADTDAAALYTGTLGGGQIVLSSSEVSATVFIDDFSNLVAGQSYYFALGIKFTGDLVFREPELQDERGRDVLKIFITKDIIRG